MSDEKNPSFAPPDLVAKARELRATEAKPLGTIGGGQDSRWVKVNPPSAIRNFRPGMELRFACGAVERAGYARLVTIDNGWLTFDMNLNVLVPAVCNGDAIYEYAAPCRRCRCAECETRPGTETASSAAQPEQKVMTPSAPADARVASPRQEESSTPTWHFMINPGECACDADYPNMSKTADYKRVNCKACIDRVENPRSASALPDGQFRMTDDPGVIAMKIAKDFMRANTWTESAMRRLLEDLVREQRELGRASAPVCSKKHEPPGPITALAYGGCVLCELEQKDRAIIDLAAQVNELRQRSSDPLPEKKK